MSVLIEALNINIVHISMYLVIGRFRGFELLTANELPNSNDALSLEKKISENKYNKNIKFLSFDINKKKCQNIYNKKNRLDSL
jgi:hypothetical protein